MNKKNLSLIITMLILATLMLTSCEKLPQEKAENEDKLIITDMAGRQISLDGPANRVVALTAADCEILFAIGAGDAVIARGQYCNFPEEALQIESVSSGTETNIEQIIALDPDLVIMNMMDQTTQQIEAIEKVGIPVMVNAAKDIDGVYESIELVGKAVGKNEEASQLIENMKKSFEDIKAEKNSGDKKVYFEVSPLQYGLWTAGGDTFMDEIAKLLGVNNLFSDVSGWVEISQEQVIERNPDYIVTVTMGALEQMSPAEEIMSRQGWQSIKAVTERKVAEINSDVVARPGPRLVDAAQELYAFFYGE